MFKYKTKPFKHQEEAFELSKDKEFFALLMEMGTGKTKVAIDTFAYLRSIGSIDGVIVFAPKSICRNWAEDEIRIHLCDSIEREVFLWKKKPNKWSKEKLNIFVINIEAANTDRGYDEIFSFLQHHKSVFAIVDESTTIKNPKAQRTKVLLKIGQKCKFRRILTGTPFSNSPMDGFSQFEFLKKGLLGNSFFSYKCRYAVLVKRYINGRSFDEIVGYQRLDELRDAIGKFSYRALKKDCLDLPEKIYVVRNVEMTDEQKKIYKDIKDESIALLKSGNVISGQLAITQILRFRQVLCNLAAGENGNEWISSKDNRIEEILDILDESGDQKVIIWSWFVPVVKKIEDAIAKKYGKGSVASYYGEINEKERQERKNRFQDESSDLKYMVMQPQTGGLGLTMTAATVVIYNDHNWSLSTRLQSEDRNHRIGQKDNVTYIDLVCEGSIDSKIRDALVGKLALSQQITGDTLRQLIE